jgi:MOSC domain-containing protein YiiM
LGDDDYTESMKALQMLLDKYAPHLQAGVNYRPPVDEELKRTAVFRIDIDDISAKKKEVPSDFPGAFWYVENPMLASAQERIQSWQGEVLAIQIAPTIEAEMEVVPEVSAIVGKGLEGDRYFHQEGTFSHLGSSGRAITLVAIEDIEAMSRDHDVEITPEVSRRNIVTQNVPLNYLVGKEFQIGEVVLRGVRLCEPCDTLAERTGLGKKLLNNMQHRAGLRADIVKGGIIRAGDAIREYHHAEG